MTKIRACLTYVFLPCLFLLASAEMSAADPFSLAITRELLQEPHEATENFFISPYSMQMALHMALEGAGGKTYGQMKQVLGTAPKIQQNSSFASFQAMGIDISYLPLPSYTGALKNQFNTDILPVNFVENKEQAVYSLNQWVQKATGGMIQNLVQSGDVNAFTRLILLNAVLFKGSWHTPFHPEKTERAPFHITPEKHTSVDMMHESGTFQYGANEDASIIQLPFKRADNEPEYICTVVLPKDDAALLRIQKNPSLAAFQKGLSAEYVELFLPKVTFDFRVDLKPALQLLGIHDAFTAKANFSRMNPASDLFIDKVFQKTHLKIDEAGLEAAAATAVAFGLLSIREPDEKKTMRCDHPFFIFISERGSSEPLFVGLIRKPT